MSVFVDIWATHLEPGGKILATAGTMASGSSSKLAWTPSAFSESFTSASTDTPDDWEVCDWSEEEDGSSNDWADWDWSSRCSSEADLGLVTPKNRVTADLGMMLVLCAISLQRPCQRPCARALKFRSTAQNLILVVPLQMRKGGS